MANCFDCGLAIHTDHEPRIASGQVFHPTASHCVSALLADVQKLRNFAKDCEALWLNGSVNVESLLLMLKMNALLDDDGNPTPLLTGEPGPGGEGT